MRVAYPARLTLRSHECRPDPGPLAGESAFYAIDWYTPMAYTTPQTVHQWRITIGERVALRKDLFEQLLQSVKEMKEIQAGKRQPARVTIPRQHTDPEPTAVAQGCPCRDA